MVDVLIICLNEGIIVRDSVYRLQKEKNLNIIVVDNGSDDGSKRILSHLPGITYIDLPENVGVSRGRNAGLAKTTAKYVFLLDGDILYIPGTIRVMEKFMDDTPDAGCIGVHNTGRWDGTADRTLSDSLFTMTVPARDDFPIAWTQYGLFRGDFLRKTRFIEEGVFGLPGNGFEDDFLYLDMLKGGLRSCYIDNVVYYHDAHKGSRVLEERGQSLMHEERAAIFNKAWKEWIDRGSPATH